MPSARAPPAAADPRFVPTMPPYLDKNGHGRLGPMSQVCLSISVSASISVSHRHPPLA